MGSLVLRPIGRVTESLAAVDKVAEVRLLARVRADVNLQILLSREGLLTAQVLEGGGVVEKGK